MSPSKQAEQTRMEAGNLLGPGSKELLNAGFLSRESTHRNTGNYQSSPPPCQQAHCPQCGVQGRQCLSSLWCPQGPVARPAHCAKAKEALSDFSLAQNMDLRPAAAPDGQGSEPVPGISSLTRRHCHNYPSHPLQVYGNHSNRQMFCPSHGPQQSRSQAQNLTPSRSDRQRQDRMRVGGSGDPETPD